MAANKKKTNAQKAKKSKKYSENNYNGKLSLVIPLYNEVDRIGLMSEALKKFEGIWKSPYEVILVNDGSSDDTLSLLHATYLDSEQTEGVRYKVVDVEKNAGKGNALKMGVAEATGDHILTLDADMAATPDSLLDWLDALEGKTFDDSTILIASREHEHSVITTNKNDRRTLGRTFNFGIQILTGVNLKDTQCGFKLYPKEIAKRLFENMRVKGWAHDVELMHNAKLYNIDVVEMPIHWKEVAESKVSMWSDGLKMGAVSVVIVLVNLFQFFFTNSIKETIQGVQLSPNKEGPIYRFLFAALAIAMLFIMPYMSFDYGITADEEVQKVYGEHVLNYFESEGVQGEALTYKNLYLYGGMFDYYMAKMHKYVFTSWDVYEMRHMFNAIIGALLMLFTGLLARSVSQRWQVAFWALVFMILSPRVFGHSMNNPKDIPFAFGYVLSLFFMMNFVRHLPKPSLQASLGLIMGLAITINIRVGGILLIPYLFLFVGASLVFNKKSRGDLISLISADSFNLVKILLFSMIAGLGISLRRNVPISYLFVGMFLLLMLACFTSKSNYLKLIFSLILITISGYFLGLTYWPFAQEDLFGGPQLALAEMSNFSTGIRMIWDGEHYWSDFLPWYYIIKWFAIATPAVILVGLGFSAFPLLKDRKNRGLFLMLLFTGVFPVFYAIMKGSSLYDGMRHFLFVCPILVVTSAYSIVYLMTYLENKMIPMVGAVLLVVSLYSPIRWMVVSHPNQYVYFNEFFGGIGNADNYCETDYWMNSTKEACQWFVDNVPEVKEGKEVLVATQAYISVKHYFADYPNVKPVYTRYHERVKNKWDYGLYLTRFVNRGFIESGLWPPGEKKVKVKEIDGTAIWAITKRSEINKKGAEAQAAVKAKDYPKAIMLLTEVIKDNPKDESALILLGQYQLQTGNYPEAKKTLESLVNYSDSYSNGLGMMGLYKMNAEKDSEGGKEYMEKAVAANVKYVFGHYNLARLYAMEGNYPASMKSLELFDKYGGKPIQGYDLAIQVTKELKNDALKAYYTARKASFTGDWKTAIEKLNLTLSIFPDYAPALKMQADYDKAVSRQTWLNDRKERLKLEGKLK
ncbi:MAG: diguanylate cyclase/phosphodiesterase (GGDEF & EAL domains) with PAS/PAC sensor(s) [uncultured Aureispira sp.]|uniref:Diguanylate cyclase/phosphodiesterase (GGDEF & EAL domains) with PAS/PAC sensor(S) n=1 Tax=uncultured Aureispira sp. TaxID=1331704 RepID=A0A6S6SLR1_9BACT|nr:MAG: diguanylate cyclase/phosphodiesterase (GGDEF & EAL domains) with PAS/PAC sensor(s) [uncultured Aureispira sp.]